MPPENKSKNDKSKSGDKPKAKAKTKDALPPVPVDFATLSDEELQEELDKASQAFDDIYQADSVSEEDVQRAREMTGRIDEIRAEQGSRLEKAEQVKNELEEMSRRVRNQGEDQDQPEGEGDDDSEDDEPGEGSEGSEDEDKGGEGESSPEGQPKEEAPELQPVAAAARINLTRVRRSQSRGKAPQVSSGRNGGTPTITASADVPGIEAGQELDVDALTEAVMSKARGIATKAGKPGNKARVASYRLPFPEEFVVDSDGSVADGTRALVAAADQNRLPGGDLVASGGWCSPSETVYDIADIACPDMLYGPSEVQLRRGGLRFVPTPTLAVDDLSGIWTEADDEAAPGGGTKDCFHVPCPDFVDVRCDGIYTCLQAGILTERSFPELVNWYVRNSMVAHEIRVKRYAFLGATASSITADITVDETFAAFSAVYGAVALQAADLIERHSLCESISVEVTFPWWARNLFLADIARQNGKRMEEIDPGVISKAFASLGISLSWARGLTPDVPTNIGGATGPLGWPSSMSFLIHPTGAFQLGRGMEVDLGVIQDSNLYPQNDYTALFVEECVAVIPRGPEARFVTVPVCPDGETGALATAVDCPIDGGPSVT